MSAMMTRRTFAASIACATLGNAFASNASIIKSASAAKTTSFLHQDEDFSLIPYVQDGLMSFWDAIWNASIGKTDEKQRMVDLCRHNGDIYVSSGVATFGSMVEFDGELSFVCDDMKHANALIANGVYDENAKFMVSMLTDLANVPSDAYREGITIADCNPSSSLYAAFEVSS